MKKPNIGDIIEHREPAFDRVNIGKVVQLLSMQFVYETKEGHIRHCMFKEIWSKVNQ